MHRLGLATALILAALPARAQTSLFGEWSDSPACVADSHRMRVSAGTFETLDGDAREVAAEITVGRRGDDYTIRFDRVTFRSRGTWPPIGLVMTLRVAGDRLGLISFTLPSGETREAPPGSEDAFHRCP